MKKGLIALDDFDNNRRVFQCLAVHCGADKEKTREFGEIIFQYTQNSE